MRAKSIVLICIALGCGLVASIGISQVIDGKSSKSAEPEMTKVFVAARNVDIAEKFKPENVRLEPWPKGKVPEGAITDLKQLENKFARTRLYKGEPLNQGKLMDARGGLPDHVPTGYRVCSIKVNMVTSISGLLKPGDRVDIIAILRRGKDIGQTQTKLVLEAVRIFAVNAQTERFVDERGKTIDAKTVSVLVKNGQVAPLIMASELGTLRLTMRGRQVDPGEESITQEFTIDQFLGNDSEVADDKDRFAQATEGPDFSQFLKQTTQQQPTIVEPVERKPDFSMEIHTPEGIRTWEFLDGKARLAQPAKKADAVEASTPISSAAEETNSKSAITPEPETENHDDESPDELNMEQ